MSRPNECETDPATVIRKDQQQSAWPLMKERPHIEFSPLLRVGWKNGWAENALAASIRASSVVPPASKEARVFTAFSQLLPARILCLTGLWPVATLVIEALSAGFADAASTAIPAHSEAMATPSLETCSASVAFLADTQRAQRNRLRQKISSSSECPGFATVRKPKRSKARRSLRNRVAPSLEEDLTSPVWRTWPATVRYAPCGACCQNAEAADGAVTNPELVSYGRRPTF